MPSIYHCDEVQNSPKQEQKLSPAWQWRSRDLQFDAIADVVRRRFALEMATGTKVIDQDTTAKPQQQPWL
ncbi:hypothetical protein, partial [Trichormus sp. NMC-1]|uniref:hypothetical protein n=1 Tax=Trichormus sp. NMC-1 TaxID=1853259 RepID=UPI001F283B29